MGKRKMEKYFEMAGDILEAFGGLVAGANEHAREFRDYQRILEDDAKEILHLLSNWMSKVMQITKYRETLDPYDKIIDFWIKESNQRPQAALRDFDERELLTRIQLSYTERSDTVPASSSTPMTPATMTRAATPMQQRNPVRENSAASLTQRRPKLEQSLDWKNSQDQIQHSKNEGSDNVRESSSTPKPVVEPGAAPATVQSRMLKHISDAQNTGNQTQLSDKQPEDMVRASLSTQIPVAFAATSPQRTAIFKRMLEHIQKELGTGPYSSSFTPTTA